MISGQVKETDVHTGDTVRIYSQVIEGGKTRTQVFEGILISMHGRAENKMFTVRKIGAGGIGVERIWPVDARSIVKVEVKKKTTGVRRSKLYYLRERIGKQAVIV